MHFVCDLDFMCNGFNVHFVNDIFFLLLIAIVTNKSPHKRVNVGRHFHMTEIQKGFCCCTPVKWCFFNQSIPSECGCPFK